MQIKNKFDINRLLTIIVFRYLAVINLIIVRKQLFVINFVITNTGFFISYEITRMLGRNDTETVNNNAFLFTLFHLI